MTSIESVPIGEIVAFIGMAGTLGGCIIFLFKLWNRFTKMERRSLERQEDTAMIFESLRGCLQGLHENGCNGPVTETLKKLDHYIGNKAAGLTGDGKRR